MKQRRGNGLGLLIVLIIHVALISCSSKQKQIDIWFKNGLPFDIVITADIGLPSGPMAYPIKAGVTMKYHIPAGIRPSEIRIEVKQ